MSRIRSAAWRIVAAVSLGFTPALADAQDYVPGEVLVKIKSKPSAEGAQRFFHKSVFAKGMILKRSWAGINMHKLALRAETGASRMNAPQDVNAIINELRADPEVEFAEPNYYVKSQSTGVDPQRLSSDQVQAMAGNGSFAQSGAPIDAQESWSILSSSTTTPVVAIIDTGVDYNHRVFTQSGAIWTNPYEVAGNGVDDDGNGYVDDVRGWNFVANNNAPMDDDEHGTHVAGIVLGVGQDIRVNPATAAKIRIMPLKFLDGNGVGTTSDAIEAIYYAANNGADVLNNSWGGGGYSQALVDAITYAYSKKVVFVAAAGNAANNNDAAPTYPSSYVFPNLISVAATSDWDSLASFSNYGASSVHVGSPGVSIFSTLPSNTFGYANGTSMATPFVSGVAALMLREAPDMNGYQIKQLLFNAAESVSGLDGKVSTKARLNVYNAVEKAQTTDTDAYYPSYDSGANTRAVASSGAKMQGGCGLVAKSLWDARHRGGGGGSGESPMRTVAFFGLLALLMAPVLLSVHLRQKSGKNKRQHARYQIDSQVRVKFGDRELIGSVSSISLGGVQLNTDAWLEHGGVVAMQIASPDGKDVINVEGKIVWCEEQKRYGVAFQNAEETALQAISRWTQALLKI